MCISRLVGDGGWGQVFKNRTGEDKQERIQRPGRLVVRAMGSQESTAALWVLILLSVYWDNTAL